MAKKKAVKKKAATRGKTTQPRLRKLLDELSGRTNDKQAEAIAKIRRICDGLAATTGIKTITYEYSGEGDSGAMHDVTYTPKPKIAIPEALQGQLETCAWEFIPAGFENNEGGYGTLTIDIAKHKISIAHSERIVETNDTEEEFDF